MFYDEISFTDDDSIFMSDTESESEHPCHSKNHLSFLLFFIAGFIASKIMSKN